MFKLTPNKKQKCKPKYEVGKFRITALKKKKNHKYEKEMCISPFCMILYKLSHLLHTLYNFRGPHTWSAGTHPVC